MKRAFYIVCKLIIAVFIAHNESWAGVVKSTEKMNRNYDLHHRVIIYKNLSSFQKPPSSSSLLSQQPNNLNNSKDNNDSATNFSKIDNPLSASAQNIRDIEMSFSSLSLAQDSRLLHNQQGAEIEDMSVGSFLDSFKNDPKLRTLYFTSKDLTFSYKKAFSNVMQLDLDMDAASYEKLEKIEKIKREKEKLAERPLTRQEEERAKQETRLIFSLFSESFKTILYVLVGLIGALYLSFRYILNKYI